MKEESNSQANKGGRWLDALAILHLAVAVIIGSALVQTCRIMANPATATGVVESKKMINGGEDPDTYQLSYSFATSAGTHYGRASVSTKIYDRTSVGEPVTVQYAADDPGNNRLVSETGDPDVGRFVGYASVGLVVFLFFGPRRWLAMRNGEPDPALT